MLTMAPGEGEAVWFTNSLMEIKARGSDTGGAYGLVEIHAPVGSAPPRHMHADQDEAFWLISGKVRFEVGEERTVAGPGSFVFLPRGVPHAFIVEDEAHFLAISSPGGFESFFVAAGEPASAREIPAPAAPDVPKLQAAAAEFKVEIVGPPLTLEAGS